MLELKMLDKLISEARTRKDHDSICKLIEKRNKIERQAMGLNEVETDEGTMYEFSADQQDETYLEELVDLNEKLDHFFKEQGYQLDQIVPSLLNLITYKIFLHDKEKCTNTLAKHLEYIPSMFTSIYERFYHKKG